MVKPKVKKQESKKRVKKQSEADDENTSVEVNCCIPIGFECQQPEILVSRESCVRLRCSLAACSLSGLLHQRCFQRLEAQGVSALANCKGRARDWTTREREKNLWHDRGYELVYRMFPCRCGHGFLRKEEEEDNPGQQGPAVKKKKQKEKPKLNVTTKLVSQKVCGEYFPEVTTTEKVPTSRRPVPASPQRKEPPEVPPAKVIPGLSVEGEKPKPLRLNLDLSSIVLTAIKSRQSGDSKKDSPAQARPGIAGDSQPSVSQSPSLSRLAASDIGDDIFLSDDDDVEEEEEREKERELNNNNTMECTRLSEENMALRLENQRLKEKMLAERRLYEEYHGELRKENQILEANLELLELMKSRELERSLQALKSDLEEKDDQLRKNTETIQELNKVVSQERKNSAVLRGLIVEEMIKGSPVKSDEKQVKGIFVSEAELQKVAGKLKMFDEIAARLKSSQARSEGRIVQLERDLETVQLENVQFRKQINNLNKMINVFDLM